MHSSSWSSTPIMGLVPLFHLDPAVGGPPLASPDGHWWWDGERWAPRSTEAVAVPVEVSVEPPVELPLEQPVVVAALTADSPAA